MWASDPLEARAVLGAVKARPGNGRARCEVGATAGLALRQTFAPFLGKRDRRGQPLVGQLFEELR
jgi:hypothetical protein